MSNAARKARKKAHVKFVKEPKTPTRKYLSKEDIQIKKARQKAAEKRIAATAARLGAAFTRGQQNPVEFK